MILPRTRVPTPQAPPCKVRQYSKATAKSVTDQSTSVNKISSMDPVVQPALPPDRTPPWGLEMSSKATFDQDRSELEI